METNTGRESIVARLFGFGKKRSSNEAPQEQGFSRTKALPSEPVEVEADGDGASITVPEQVIRIRTSSRKDEVVNAIGESFTELTKTLISVNDRLDRQDSRAGVLAEQLKELPEYLRTLPRLAEEQNNALRCVAQAQEQQVHAVRNMAEALGSIPDAMREGTAAQEQAIRKVAAAQQHTTKVIHHHQQRSLKAFELATQKSLQQQQRQMESVMASSQRMFRLTAIFMGITILAVVVALLVG